MGVAVADDLLRAAHGLKVLERQGEDADLACLRSLVEEYEVDRIVLGLPLNMNGTEGASARMARSFAERLEKAIGVPVELCDERLSTFEAEGRLRELGLSAREMKGRVDAEAAAVILQGWLDGRTACVS
jgi:putative Holliday junction resolvase